MKHLTIPMLLVILALFGCKNSTKPMLPETNEPQQFENEYLSFTYPSDWEIAEEGNDLQDSTVLFKEGFSLLVAHPDNMSTGLPAVYIVKSSTFDLFETPEEWRDASIQFKQFEEDYYEVEGIIDSIYIADEPAALVIFKRVAENSQDTVIQIQHVILRENKDLYYINSQFAPSDSIGAEIGLNIITSLQFK